MRTIIFLLIILLFSFKNITAQPENFTKIVENPVTSVKDQARTGCCWCFATLSYLESELLRIQNKEYNLSENYVVYYNYVNKAIMFVRMRGNITFTQGGQSHDVFNVIKKYGIVTEEAFPFKSRNHSFLEDNLKKYLDSVVGLESISSDWIDGYIKILNNTIGTPPKEFDFDGKKYTPLTFNEKITKIRPEDYIEITSFNHQNFYQWFVLEDMYNWHLDEYFNVPLDKMMSIIDLALEKGYTIDWDGDVSEKEFSPYTGIVDLKKLDKDKKIDEQEFRQNLYDRHITTVDHLMHIVGVYKDENGTKYYKVKNSWGSVGTYKGYIYISETFIKYKTVAITVHKDVLPADIKEKL